MSLFDTAAPRTDSLHRDIDPASVSALAGKPPRVRLVDVREPAEFSNELGHVPGAELVPMGRFPEAAEEWNKNEDLVLVCRSGNRSGKVAALLAGLGFVRAMNMAGGMIAYNEAKLPVER